MRVNLLFLSSLLLLGTPAMAHGKKGSEGMSFAEAKAARLMYLRRKTACVAKADNFEAMRACWAYPKGKKK